MEFQQYIDDRLISVDIHPETGWKLLKYTKTAQFDRLWYPEVRAARSLVLDENNMVISPCLPKFFNDFQEAEELKSFGYQTYEKLDGSVIYIFKRDGKMYVRSNSRWDSEIAKAAEAFAVKNGLSDYIEEGTTYMCEWIHPLNRIVVDYGSKISLILLCALVHDANGWSTTGVYQLAPEEVEWPFEKARQIMLAHDEVENLRGKIPSGEEGYILWDRISNLRTKIKSEEYLILHRTVENLTPRLIYDIIMADDEKALDKVRLNMVDLDEQTIDLMTAVIDGMLGQITCYKETVREVFETIKHIEDRKMFSEAVKKQRKSLSGGLFALFDGHDLDKLAKKSVDLKYWNKFVKLKGEMDGEGTDFLPGYFGSR